jgi:hypothetical protein
MAKLSARLCPKMLLANTGRKCRRDVRLLSSTIHEDRANVMKIVGIIDRKIKKSRLGG